MFTLLNIGTVPYNTGPQIRTMLMGEMMAMTAAETMEFSTAEDELYSLHADVAVSMFNRQEQVHLEEYVGGLTAATSKSDIPFALLL